MAVIDRYADRIKIHVINAQLCAFPGYEQYVAGDLQKLVDIDAQSERGYQFCGWSQGEFNYLCVSEIGGDDLEKFENQFREHLNL